MASSKLLSLVLRHRPELIGITLDGGGWVDVDDLLAALAAYGGPGRQTATGVGARRGRPRVLSVDAAAMAQAGHVFLCSANGVWLVDAVPPEFLALL